MGEGQRGTVHFLNFLLSPSRSVSCPPILVCCGRASFRAPLRCAQGQWSSLSSWVVAFVGDPGGGAGRRLGRNWNHTVVVQVGICVYYVL